MLLLTACGVLLLAEKPIMDNWNVLRGAPTGCDWQAVGAGSGKIAAAAGWRDDELVVRSFTTDGTLLSERSVTIPEGLNGGTITRVMPVRDGLAYLAIYGPNADKLYCYRIGDGEGAERLLAIPCVGASFYERTARTSISELNCEDGVLSFAVRKDNSVESYLCREGGGVEEVGTGICGGQSVYSIFSAQNGTLLIGGAGYLTQNGRKTGSFADGQSVTCLTQGRGGWYYIDAARLSVCFVDAAFGSSQNMFQLDTGARRLTSVSLTRDESALMLLDGVSLTLTDAEGTRELTGILRPTPMRAWFGLAKYALLSLLAAGLLWLTLCGLRNGYASMIVFRGGFMLAIILLSFTVLRYAWLNPMLYSVSVGENEQVVSGVLRATTVENRMSDESLVPEVCRMLEGVGTENRGNVRVVLAKKNDGEWRKSDGRLAVAVDGFSPALVDAAQSEGLACEKLGGVFRYARVVGPYSLCITLDNAAEPDSAPLSYALLATFAVLALLALMIISSVGIDIRRLSRRMEKISQGVVPERLNLHTGDELESMASIVNYLGVSLKKQEEERENVEHSYRRFVPEKVLALLGKQSIRDVDKSAFASRRMAVMTVWFSFPESIYTDMNNSRLLFDSVNEVIERTASIVARKGGTVFHFAYNGFDVVMDEGGEAVSTAVAIQQEVLSLNELRAQNRLPAVTLRIALDVGDVMLGIVGDNSQMEPTTISSSLSIVQELIDLSNRLKAGILCTEAIISEKQEYGNRYMGKCVVGSQPVRVYEIFDGDEFNVRRGKEASMRDFSQGVYDLYGGDAASAKHMFLQLAHNYPFDGGARYYLYLADRLEHDPSLPCVLNMDNAGRGEI
jgi:HAMP domain-containing protein